MEQTEGELIAQKKDIDYMKEKMDNIEDKLDAFIKCADEKYSSKWVEKAVIWAAGVVGTAGLIGLISLLVQAFLFFSKK